MIITDRKMEEKLCRALKHGNDMYDLTDIENALKHGKMQGHVAGKTWAITQVHDFPRGRQVEIVFVIGDMKDTAKLESQVAEWAKAIGASMLTAIGREGWWNLRTEGWKKSGVLYTKEL